jgi:hypothetical protein
MTWAAANSLTSKLQLSIATVFTNVPGVQNLEVDTGNNSTWEAWDLSDTYEKKLPTGVKGGGKISGKRLIDPLDAVDQFLHVCHNNQGVPDNAALGTLISGKAFLGATGVELAFTGTLTVYKITAEKKNGLMADFEFEPYDQIDLNEADPA